MKKVYRYNYILKKDGREIVSSSITVYVTRPREDPSEKAERQIRQTYSENSYFDDVDVKLILQSISDL
ncbi:UNVERIFIED_CONTAM: hypothetical protein ABID98_003163 [Brevibacillus sp. OAP136]